MSSRRPTPPAPLVVTLGEAIVALMRHPAQGPGYLGPFASGAPCIFAHAAARAGCRVRIGMGTGRDDFGELMTSTLAEAGVEVALAHTDPDRPTASAFVRYHEDGSRSFIFYLAATAALNYPPERVGPLLAGADWLHISGSTLAFGGTTATAAETALEAAHERGIPVSIDPNVRPEAFDDDLITTLRRHLPRARVVFASTGELDALGVDALDLADQGVTVFDKQGAAGAQVLQGMTWHQVPAIAVDQVDPDGAGDIFAAAAVAALLAGQDPVAATRYACRAAGESVAHHGPMTSPITRLPAWEG
ncbi:MAG: carbohydrate kinase family protein [Propioniciclava sp.]